MKKVLGIFSICIFFSCSSKFYIGTYGSPDLPYSFEFKNDGTFYYRYQLFFTGSESNGTWRADGKNKIILDSYIKSRTLLLKEYHGDSIVSPDSTITSYSLSIHANIPKAQQNCYECLIYIDDSLYALKNCDSMSFITVPKKINDLYLRIHSYAKMPGRFYDTLTTVKYYPKIGNQINAEVVFNDSIFNYKVFDNVEYYVMRNALKFYDSSSKKWIKIPLAAKL